MRGKNELYKSFFILCQLILLLALVHGGRPNARNNWIFFIPIFILCIYSSFFCASARATSDYPFVQVFINLIPTSSDYVLLRNRQGSSELRKIGQKKDTSEMSFTERLAWASSLLSTSRGIGWAHEPTAHIPPRPTASKRKFIVSQLTWIFLRFIVFDAALIHIRQNPCYRTGGPSLGAFGWQWRMTAWVFIVSIYCSMNNLYAALSVVAVATRLYEPRDWPPLFGSPLYSYTVRNCWGYVFFQLCFFPSFFLVQIAYKKGNSVQTRLAPNAPQNPDHQLQLCLNRPPPPTPYTIHHLLQTLHLVPHLRAHPRNGGLRPLPQLLPRRRSSVFPLTSRSDHIRRCRYRCLLAPPTGGGAEGR